MDVNYKRRTCSYERNIGLMFRSFEVELFVFWFEPTIAPENTIVVCLERGVSGLKTSFQVAIIWMVFRQNKD